MRSFDSSWVFKLLTVFSVSRLKNGCQNPGEVFKIIGARTSLYIWCLGLDCEFEQMSSQTVSTLAHFKSHDLIIFVFVL